MVRRAIVGAAFVSLAAGCGGEDPPEQEAAVGGGGSGGTGGASYELPCSGSEVLFEGECTVPGVPADGCAPGFEHDGDGSCSPVLPDAACPAGELALPGETECRPVAACGTEPWGDIPVEPNTQYVDQAYGGGDSDGSAAKPWLTIGQGIQAADSGAIVAIAAGSYAESQMIIGRHVRLWGRCPALVEIDGGSAQAALLFGQSTSEIHQLAVIGERAGVGGSWADLLLDRVWIHDTGGAGVQLQDNNGPVTVTVQDSLIERVGKVGILLLGGSVVVERTVVRDTRLVGGYDGRGIEIQRSPFGGAAASALVRSSLVLGSDDSGLMAFGAEVTIEDSAIVDSRGLSLEAGTGRGVHAQADPLPGDTELAGQGALTMSRSVVSSCSDHAVLLSGSAGHLDGTTLRHVGPAGGSGLFGRGLTVQGYQDSVPSVPAAALVRRSTIRSTEEVGLCAFDAPLELERVLVRDVAAHPSHPSGQSFGDGIMAVATISPEPVVVDGTFVHTVDRAGISSFGAPIQLSGTVVACAPIGLNGELWAGFDAQFEDGGANGCGCDGAWEPCHVLTTALSPPGPGENL